MNETINNLKNQYTSYLNTVTSETKKIKVSALQEAFAIYNQEMLSGLSINISNRKYSDFSSLYFLSKSLKNDLPTTKNKGINELQKQVTNLIKGCINKDWRKLDKYMTEMSLYVMEDKLGLFNPLCLDVLGFEIPFSQWADFRKKIFIPGGTKNSIKKAMINFFEGYADLKGCSSNKGFKYHLKQYCKNVVIITRENDIARLNHVLSFDEVYAILDSFNIEYTLSKDEMDFVKDRKKVKRNMYVCLTEKEVEDVKSLMTEEIEHKSPNK